MLGEGAARFTGFGVPAQQLAQLAIVAKAGDISDACEQNGLPDHGHDRKASQDSALLSRLRLQHSRDCCLDLLDLTVDEAELVEQPVRGLDDGVGVRAQAGARPPTPSGSITTA